MKITGKDRSILLYSWDISLAKEKRICYDNPDINSLFIILPTADGNGSNRKRETEGSQVSCGLLFLVPRGAEGKRGSSFVSTAAGVGGALKEGVFRLL